jgi:AraC family transcriptional regulator
MVCQRCISVVQKELSQMNIPVMSVTLGEVSLQAPLKNEHMDRLRQALAAYGFEILDNKQSSLVKSVKAVIDEMFSESFSLADIKFSKHISGRLYKNYDVISSNFSGCEGITLEKYILNRRIEKVKELLVYSDQSINDISFNLGYSSVAHLSKQFKTMTGLNLSHYRQMNKAQQVAA